MSGRAPDSTNKIQIIFNIIYHASSGLNIRGLRDDDKIQNLFGLGYANKLHILSTFLLGDEYNRLFQ